MVKNRDAVRNYFVIRQEIIDDRREHVKFYNRDLQVALTIK